MLLSVEFSVNLKKSFVPALSSLFLFASFNSYADFSLPSTVNLLALNGNKVKEPDSIVLPKGDNQLVIQYDQTLKYGSTKKKYRSKPMVLTVKVEDGSDEMTISHKFFRDYHIAKASFANDQVDWAFTVNDESYPVAPVVLPGNPGLLPYQDIEKALDAYNFDHGIKLTSAELAPEPLTGDAIAPQTQVSNEVVELQFEDTFVTDIKKWYKNASSEDRKALLKWMIDNQ